MTRACRAPLWLALVTVIGAVSACSGSGGAQIAGGGEPTSTSPSTAGSTGDEGTITAARSRFQITYRLDGSIVRSEDVGVDVPIGLGFRGSVESGARVQAGTHLGDLVLPPGDSTAGPGTVDRSRHALAEARLGSLSAPLAGVAQVSASAVRVVRPGLDVVVPLRPLQELRYRGMPFTGTASVETVLGQRQVPCQAVWLAPRRAADRGDSDSLPGTASVHCRLPDSAETAPGLPATLTLTSPEQADVIVVPLIFIGLDDRGENYVARVRSGEDFIERAVVVGSTDGVRRVVSSGLGPGDVLAPVEMP